MSIKMKSPNGGTVIGCHKSNVEARLNAGWKIVDKKEKVLTGKSKPQNEETPTKEEG